MLNNHNLTIIIKCRASILTRVIPMTKLHNSNPALTVAAIIQIVENCIRISREAFVDEFSRDSVVVVSLIPMSVFFSSRNYKEDLPIFIRSHPQYARPRVHGFVKVLFVGKVFAKVSSTVPLRCCWCILCPRTPPNIPAIIATTRRTAAATVTIVNVLLFNPHLLLHSLSAMLGSM